jgi:hypothetical protein
MWFDARAKLAEIAGHPPGDFCDNCDTSPGCAPRVASVASVATPLHPKSDPAPPARADGLDPDAAAYLDRLHLHGPQTYGAMASTLGWGATRAWRAEARLRAAGLVRMDRLGRAVPTERGQP